MTDLTTLAAAGLAVEKTEAFRELFQGWKETEWVDESDAMECADLVADTGAAALTEQLANVAGLLETQQLCIVYHDEMLFEEEVVAKLAQAEADLKDRCTELIATNKALGEAEADLKKTKQDLFVARQNYDQARMTGYQMQADLAAMRHANDSLITLDEAKTQRVNALEADLAAMTAERDNLSRAYNVVEQSRREEYEANSTLRAALAAMTTERDALRQMQKCDHAEIDAAREEARKWEWVAGECLDYVVCCDDPPSDGTNFLSKENLMDDLLARYQPAEEVEP